MNDDKVLNELKKLCNYMAILSIDPTKKLLEVLIEKKILTTEQRIKMFLLIDGERTTLEIAEKIGIGVRGAQYFVKELEDKEFIRTERRGNAVVPIKNYEKIIEFIHLAE